MYGLEHKNLGSIRVKRVRNEASNPLGSCGATLKAGDQIKDSEKCIKPIVRVQKAEVVAWVQSESWGCFATTASSNLRCRSW
ncbi:hypothetical protein CFP56_014064, partial [Quercus suber]